MTETLSLQLLFNCTKSSSMSSIILIRYLKGHAKGFIFNVIEIFDIIE
jgi:hypothetical protein